MFTGIIEHIGQIKAIQAKKNLIILSIDMGQLASKVRLGDSVAVNGACLTATMKKGKVIGFDLMKETIEQTSLKQLKVSSLVNLELALQAGSRVGGHFVTGHVDEASTIMSITKDKNWVAIRISISKAHARYFVPKGSVTVDGISLTVGKVGKGYVDVYLIPYTLKITTLGLRKVGDLVNIETDILAKYVYSEVRGREVER